MDRQGYAGVGTYDTKTTGGHKSMVEKVKEHMHGTAGHHAGQGHVHTTAHTDVHHTEHVTGTGVRHAYIVPTNSEVVTAGHLSDDHHKHHHDHHVRHAYIVPNPEAVVAAGYPISGTNSISGTTGTVPLNTTVTGVPTEHHHGHHKYNY